MKIVIEIKDDGKAWAVKGCPEEPETCYNTTSCDQWCACPRMKDYQKALASCERILIEDMNKVKALLSKEHFFRAYTPDRFLKPGLYQVPNVEWEKEWLCQKGSCAESNTCIDETFCAAKPYAILKDSPNTGKELMDALDKLDKYCAGKDYFKKSANIESKQQEDIDVTQLKEESQEELFRQVIEIFNSQHAVYGRPDYGMLKDKFTITRKNERQ